MLKRLRDAVGMVRDLVSSLEIDRMPADDVASLVESFAELERLAVAGRTLTGRRIERSTIWSDQGYRTPARWMAAKAQTTIAAAITTIETGRRLEQLPATRQAVQSGSLSALQAADISAAAAADPRFEVSLLEAARVESVSRLRERCRQVLAASSRDEDADERIHRSRYLRSWMEADGAVRLDARLTADAAARLISVVNAQARKLLEQARRAGSKERAEAFAADALLSLADTGTERSRAVVHVHVEWTRLLGSAAASRKANRVRLSASGRCRSLRRGASRGAGSSRRCSPTMRMSERSRTWDAPSPLGSGLRWKRAIRRAWFPAATNATIWRSTTWCRTRRAARRGWIISRGCVDGITR